jgi:hypothetical protein
LFVVITLPVFMVSKSQMHVNALSSSGMSTGSFFPDGWQLDQPGDDPRSAQFASAHESHHKQLQDSTSYGALARVYFAMARASSDERYLSLARQLTKASERVQEAFASWGPAMALGWNLQQLTAAYPEYRSHYLAMEGIVGSIASPYVRLQAAHAVARACMQTVIIERALQAGLTNFSLSMIRNRELPDSRFAALRRRPPLWHECTFPDTDPRLAWLTGRSELTTDMFDREFEDLWVMANGVCYAAAVAALDGSRYNTANYGGTLGTDDHLDWTPRLIEAAGHLTGLVDIQPGSADRATRAAEARAVVLGNIESETFTVGGPLAARVLPGTTPPLLMAADVERPHLFLTMRPTLQLLANYALEPGSATIAAPVTTVLRRTVAEAGRTVVELLPLDDDAMVAVTGCGLPLVTVIPLTLFQRSMADRNLPSPSALLLDVPLAPHLDLWLTPPASRFRFTLLRTESFGRVVPLLIARLEQDASPATPLLLRPLSHSSVRIHKAALAELHPQPGKVIEDGSFLADYRENLDLLLAHITGEEVRFSYG